MNSHYFILNLIFFRIFQTLHHADLYIHCQVINIFITLNLRKCIFSFRKTESVPLYCPYIRWSPKHPPPPKKKKKKKTKQNKTTNAPPPKKKKNNNKQTKNKTTTNKQKKKTEKKQKKEKNTATTTTTTKTDSRKRSP